MDNIPDQLTNEATRMVIRYFVEPSVATVAKRTGEFIKEISRKGASTESTELPSASIIGIGRCGTNIALLAAGLLSQSSKLLSVVGNQTDDPSTPEFIEGLTRWWQRRQPQKKLPNSRVNPVILIGDFDQETFERLSRKYSEDLPNLPDYRRCRLFTQMQDYQIGGAGNIPLVGQYLGQAALATPVDETDLAQPTDEKSRHKRDWVLNRNYFIDSPGTEYNASRLFIYVFSSGGGTGSGMTPELGLAQQYAIHSKFRLLEDESLKKNPTGKDRRREPKFESICSIGVAVLPDMGVSATSNATFINTGRLLCRFLAHQQRNQDRFVDGREIETLRLFNGLMLVSNESMRSVADEKTALTEDQLQTATNRYIAQQVFNILTAQELTKEQPDSAKVVFEAIENGDVIHFDAADLSNSINGPIVVAYSEAKTKLPDIDDLILRAISAPHKNPDTDAIEGISVLPLSPSEEEEDYQTVIANRGTNYEHLVETVPLFRGANSVTTVISVPNDFKLKVLGRQQISEHIGHLFPNAKVRRYALVKGVSNSVSFTILISGSGALCEEALAHFAHYASNCFSTRSTEANAEVVNQIIDAIKSKSFSEESLTELDRDVEDLSPVLAAYPGLGTWRATKQPLENTYNKIVGDDRFMPIDELMITRRDVLDALKYLNVSFHHSTPKEMKASLRGRPVNTQANPQTIDSKRGRPNNKQNS